MKILIVITGHRHNAEYKYFGQFLEKCLHLSSSECEVFIHSNCKDNDIFQNTRYITNKKRIYITDKNIGHNLGGIEAVGDTIHMLGLANADCVYDYVIHVHPDVFIVNDQKLVQILSEELHTDNAFIVNRSFPDKLNWYSFDFFIFKPRKIGTNIFSNYETYTECPERFLYNAIVSHNIPHIVIPRYDDNRWFPRRIDLNYMWHEHDLSRVERFIRENITQMPAFTYEDTSSPVNTRTTTCANPTPRSAQIIDKYVRNNRNIRMWF
jgi:hypothetical protein